MMLGSELYKANITLTQMEMELTAVRSLWLTAAVAEDEVALEWSSDTPVPSPCSKEMHSDLTDGMHAFIAYLHTPPHHHSAAS